MLIESYGLPRYGTIDPTVFTAISFLIMFGAMFGDIGHGLVLMIVGMFLGRKKATEQLKQAKALLLYCGGSSIVFGILYGSVFGFEFKSLWLKPIENIMEVFKLSVYLGIGMISLGVVFNIINSLRDKNYAKALFDKSGLIGGIIYWAAIGLITKMLVSQAPVSAGYALVIGIGVIALFLFPLVECVMHKKMDHFLEAFMESLVGILEVFMGYLANTVSFIRVAAFALAHAGLFIAIFNLAKIVHSPDSMGGIMAGLVEVFGNILVICLEGLVVSIQAVRLNYYEFFSKFFIAGKRMYKPLSL
jgi:V/A-type H+-transporting ATPase subunit I